MIRPMIGSWEVPRIEAIRALETRRLQALPVPGLSGDLHQDLGRAALRLEIVGSLHGDEARDAFLSELRRALDAGEPVDFVADILHEAVLEQVLIQHLDVAEVAGSADAFRYTIRLREHTEPPPPDPGGFGGIPGLDDLDLSLADELGLDIDLGLDLLDIPGLAVDVPALDDVLTPVEEAAAAHAAVTERAADAVTPATNAAGDASGRLETELAQAGTAADTASTELTSRATDLASVGLEDGAVASVAAASAEVVAVDPGATLATERDRLLGELRVQTGEENSKSPAGPLAALEAPLDRLEALTAQDVRGRAEALRERLEETLRGRTAVEVTAAGVDGGLFGALEAMRRESAGAGLGESLRLLAASVGLDLDLDLGLNLGLGSGGPDSLGVGDLLGAARAGSEILGGAMAIEAATGEAGRVAGILQSRFGAATLQARSGALDGLFTTDTGRPLAAQLVDDVAAGDAAAGAEVAEARLRRLGRRLDQSLEDLAGVLGQGEATLLYLDVPALSARLDVASGLLRNVDPSRLGVVGMRLERLAGRLVGGPLGERLAGLPPLGLDGLLTRAEESVDRLAQRLRDADLGAVLAPYENALGAVREVVADVRRILDGVVLEVRSALERIRDAVAALPTERLAGTLDGQLAAVRTVLERLGLALDAVRAALDAAVDAAKQGLDGAGEAISTLQEGVDAAFGAARTALEEIGLEHVAGTVADAVASLDAQLEQVDPAQALATAGDAVETALGVVSKVPWSLLPDSMAGEVEEALRPVREADVDAFDRTVREALALADDGTLGAVAVVDEALEQLATAFAAVLETVELHGVDALAETLRPSLDTLRVQVEALEPRLVLEPVQGALGQVRGLAGSLDPEPLLAPFDAPFEDLLAAIDRYSPAQLVAPLEERVDAVRGQLVDAIELDAWADRIDAFATDAKVALDRIDPSRLEPTLRRAWELARAAVATLAARGASEVWAFLGSFVRAALSGSGLQLTARSFEVVVPWLLGGGGRTVLEQRLDGLAVAVAATHDAVESVDPAALGRDVKQQITGLRSAVSSIPDAALRQRLLGHLEAIDPRPRLAQLVTHRARYLERLAAARAATDTLARRGFPEVDAVGERLRVELRGFVALRVTLEPLARPLGLDPARPLAESLEQVLDTVPVERLLAIVQPLVDALLARAAEIVDAGATPLRTLADDLEAIVAALDLTPLREGIEEVQAAVRGEVKALHPRIVLAPVVALLETLRAELAGFDPLGDVETGLEELRARAAQLVEQLDVDALLAEPRQVQDQVLTALRAVDPQRAAAPLRQRLADQGVALDDALDRFVDAFRGLQASLPSTS
ncbi:MAG: hypothetical protein AAGC60_20385 [Acidobacteriota bacterium]